MIHRWKTPDLNLKCRIIKILIPYADLLDSLVGIITLSCFSSNLGFRLTTLFAEMQYKSKKTQ